MMLALAAAADRKVQFGENQNHWTYVAPEKEHQH
jgi:hypothetical protein